MIIHLFRSRFYGQYLGLMVLTALLWLDVILEPSLLDNLQPGFRQDWLNGLVGRYPAITSIASVVLLVLQAIMFNQILENYRLTARNQLLAAALYILMMSSAPVLVQPNMMIIVNFLMILLLYRIFSYYGHTEPYSIVFDTGIIIGLASLLYFPMIYFIVLVWMGLIVFLNFNWRTFTISIMALLTPYLFAGVWFFWAGSLDMQFELLISKFSFESFPAFEFDAYVFFIWPLFGLLILSGIGMVMRRITGNTIAVRKDFSMLIIFLIFALATAVFSGAMLKFHLMLAIIPLAALLSAYLSQARKIFWAEMIVALIMITIFAGKLARFL
ncbi:MAG: hypothetical protein ACLFPE_12700 [Bacteroidales bacterium]